MRKAGVARSSVAPNFSLQRSSLFRVPGSRWRRVNVSMMAGLKSPTMNRQDRQTTNAIKRNPSPNEIRPPALGIGPKPQSDRIAKSRATAVNNILKSISHPPGVSAPLLLGDDRRSRSAVVARRAGRAPAKLGDTRSSRELTALPAILILRGFPARCFGGAAWPACRGEESGDDARSRHDRPAEDGGPKRVAGGPTTTIIRVDRTYPQFYRVYRAGENP